MWTLWKRRVARRAGVVALPVFRTKLAKKVVGRSVRASDTGLTIFWWTLHPNSKNRFVAAALRTWLKMVLQAVDPWVSEADSSEGQSWNFDFENEVDLRRLRNRIAPISQVQGRLASGAFRLY